MGLELKASVPMVRECFVEEWSLGSERRMTEDMAAPLNAPSPMDAREAGRVMEVRDVQDANALTPMEVREAGRVMVVRLVHKRNALAPMEVREAGRVMEVRDVQDANALAPMEVRVLGRVTVVRLEQYCWNAA